jgi:FAD/FMN-containing dehydrogenase
VVEGVHEAEDVPLSNASWPHPCDRATHRGFGHDGAMASPSIDLDDLATLVGAANLLRDPEVMAGYAVDWTRRVHGAPLAVVRPGSTAEVAAVLAWADSHRVAVVPQGGNTGLVGGASAPAGQLCLQLTRLDTIGPVDALSGQVTVGAGVTLDALQRAARDAHLRFAVDLAARSAATIGGMVATNAGGLHVIRHGPMRAQVVGVEAVRADGTIIGDLRGLLKDNTGYHLPSLLCGSEGTLAVVTRVRVQLVAPDAEQSVALLAFSDATSAIIAATALRRGFADVSAIELVHANGVDLVCRSFDLAPPFDPPAPVLLLVEASGPAGVVERFAAAVDKVDGVRDAKVADDPERSAALWRYRERHTEAIALLGVTHKLDVTLPLGRLARFLDDVRALVASERPTAAVWLFGHAGDGNVHVNITGVDADDDDIDAHVLGLVASSGGSISAEHGIGRTKRAFLHLNRTDGEIDTMRAIKHAFDPHGTLSPGVLLP